NSFTVIVTEVNLTPVLSVPADQTIAEQTSLSVSASATDADIPANTLTFALVSAPLGMSITRLSGGISGTPGEAQGPSTNLVSVSVTDNPARRSTDLNSFTVTVTEVNLTPVLSVPADQTIAEQTSLNVSASATDADIPANTLTFALVSAPLGMSINPVKSGRASCRDGAQGQSANRAGESGKDSGVR